MGAETNASQHTMDAFIDPRDDPAPDANGPPGRTTTQPEELAELHRLCREGRVYDVERWIRAGRPLQLAQGTPVNRARVTSALEIAVQTGNHSLVFLLLSNRYDPNQDVRSPLDLALRARRFDLVSLLLLWDADPRRVDLGALFDTYNSDLFARFQDLGVDLTAGHALAEALAYHTSNRPLFGFAKRHRETNPKIQTELNIALAHHVSEENEKGVQLCLWAGADPHAPAVCIWLRALFLISFVYQRKDLVLLKRKVADEREKLLATVLTTAFGGRSNFFFLLLLARENLAGR